MALRLQPAGLVSFGLGGPEQGVARDQFVEVVFAVEVGVLEAELEREARWLVLSVRDHPTVIGIDRRAEGAVVDHVEEAMRVQARFLQHRVGFAERFQYRGQHEVHADLGQVRLPRLFADDGDASRQGLHQRAAALDGIRCSGGDHPQRLVAI